ncbi:MAG: S1 RNA-binding domain-containing protein [Planctomycetota bacterium]
MSAAYPPGTSVTGEVISCQIFGVFVRLDQLPEVTALLEIIHFDRMVDAREYPANYPSVGSAIEARVLAWCANPKDLRLTQLGHLSWIR